MDSGSRQNMEPPKGLLRIEDCLDADGGVEMPPGTTLISLIERNIANVGDFVAFRYLDYSRAADGQAHEVTWAQLGVRLRAIGARVQQAASRGERVAILAPQGIDYVAGFYAAIKAGTIARPVVRTRIARARRTSRYGVARLRAGRRAHNRSGQGRR